MTDEALRNRIFEAAEKETADARAKATDIEDGGSVGLFSDDGLALYFASRHVDDFRWSPGLGWMRNVGSVWARDDELKRFDAARRLARGVAALAKKPDVAARLASARTVAAIVTLAQSDTRLVLPVTAWDADPMLLNTPSGIVDLRTGQMRERRTDDYVTQGTAVAPDFEASAPTFTRFMQDVFCGDAELVDFMQRALGYCISGDRREQVLFFWHGSGANGKSTLLDLLQWLVGDYALKLPASALMTHKGERHPTELAQLRGKRLAVSSELEQGQHWNEALIKELTGDATLTARYMRQDFFEFAMTQKHIIAGNTRPRLRGGDPAMARRMVLVPFTEKFDGTRRDRTMPDKLRAEGPAILAWLVRGAVRWHREGLGVPERIRAEVAEYMRDNDDLSLWMAECCERAGESKASALYASFRRWKEDCGENAPSMKVWAQQMQLVEGVSRRMSNGVRYAGIALTEAERRRATHAL